MNAEAIRALLRQQPFEPFEVRLSNGERHQVRHPENAMVIGSRMIIGYPETDRVVTVGLLHINSHELLQPAT